MDLPLVLAGLAMGVAASPHCLAMCGAPCAALGGGCARNAAGFQTGRLLGYMAGGALAAGSVAVLGRWSQAAPALRPVWTLLHLGFLALGLWWLVNGRQPAWVTRGAALPVRVVTRRARPLRSGLAGLAWVVWPCATLQAALAVSALASSAAGGALVMAAFALGSLPALAFAPWVWGWWRARGGPALSAEAVGRLGFRVGGAGLVLGSGWALGHGIWERVAGWCVA